MDDEHAWMVAWWNYDGPEIWGIYTTKEKAEEALKDASRFNSPRQPKYEIEQINLNTSDWQDSNG